jgi:glycosyltransferase involved in cell wall biosynthesis
MWFDQADRGKNPLGIACMEAMLAGKPVLTVSNVDTFGIGVLVNWRDVIILTSGEYKELAKIIIDLLEHPDKSQWIGSMAKSLASQRFAWSKIAAQTLAIYHSLVSLDD